jgi:hypothetical protein
MSVPSVSVSKDVERDEGDKNEQKEPVFSKPAHRMMIV